MKKRIGFVSNSSSSSFIFAFKEVDSDILMRKNLFFFSKREMNTGEDIFEIVSNDVLMLVKTIIKNEGGKICEVFELYDDYKDGFEEMYDWDTEEVYKEKFKSKDIENINIEMHEVDYNNCKNEEDIIDLYFEDENLEGILIKLKQELINKKIKKIKNNGRDKN